MKSLIFLAFSAPLLAQSGTGSVGIGICAGLVKCRPVALSISNTVVGNNDFGAPYTPAAGRAYFWHSYMTWQSAATANCYAEFKLSGNYYQAQSSVVINSGNVRSVSPALILTNGYTPAINCDSTGVNIWAIGVEFDITANAPFTKILTTLVASPSFNTVLTVSPGQAAGSLIRLADSFTQSCGYTNASGAARSISLYYVPNAGSAGSTNEAYVNASFGGATAAFTSFNGLNASTVTLNAGDSVQFSTNATTATQMIYCTLEQSRP